MEKEKKCTECGKTKSLESFYVHSKGKYGRAEKCKECVKKQCREYYANNNFVVRQRVKRYRDIHPDEVKECLKKYRMHNRKNLNQYERTRKREDAIFKEIKRDRTELYRIIRKGKTKNINGFLSKYIALPSTDLWNYLLRTWQEAYGVKWNGEPYHIDHIVPLCTAKTVECVDKLFHYSNLRMLTPEDNIKKKKQDMLLQNSKRDCRFSS